MQNEIPTIWRNEHIWEEQRSRIKYFRSDEVTFSIRDVGDITWRSKQ